MTAGSLIPPPLAPDDWPAADALLARAMFPDPARAARTLAAYRAPAGPLVFGWAVAGGIVCAAGLRVDGARAEVLHLGTAAAHTRQGHARALLLAVIRHLRLSTLEAETDDDSLEFYRRAGFTVEAAPARGGQARYRCTFTAP